MNDILSTLCKGVSFGGISKQFVESSSLFQKNAKTKSKKTNNNEENVDTNEADKFISSDFMEETYEENEKKNEKKTDKQEQINKKKSISSSSSAAILNFFSDSDEVHKNEISSPPPPQKHTNSQLSSSSSLDLAAYKSKHFSSFDEINAFRRKHKIYLHPKSVHTPPIRTFEEILLLKRGASETERNKNNSNDEVAKTEKEINNEEKEEMKEEKEDTNQKKQKKKEKKNEKSKTLESEWILRNLKEVFKYEKPTPVQMQSIPVFLEGGDMIVSAPTGSGKTVAFLLPLLILLQKPRKELIRSLCISPSRELAMQTLREFHKLTGKKSFKSRILDKLVGENQNIRRLDFAVCTPLRLVQLLRDSQVKLDACRNLIIDEADKLFDLGFASQLDEVLSYMQMREVQVCMYSATVGPQLLQLALALMKNPVQISIGAPNAAASTIKQSIIFVTREEGKLYTFRKLIQEGRIKPPTLVFVQTVERAQELYNELIYDGIYVDVIHSNRTKMQRDHLIEAFKTGKIWVLICTDLMARGVDFKGVNLVINFDFPQSAATYIHRIGRTGRAERQGEAISFYTVEDMRYLRVVVAVMRQSNCDLPLWMKKHLPNLNAYEKKKLQYTPIKRKRVSTISGWDLQKKQKKTQMIEASKRRKEKKKEQQKE